MGLYKGALVALSLVMLAGCRLTVGVEGEGKVTSDNGKIDCPGDCKSKLKRGKDLTLTATATEGSYFASWSGCAKESGTSCTVVGGTRNRKVTAVFAEDKVLKDAGLSEDVLLCLVQSEIDIETEKSSAVTKLECRASDFGSDAFNVAGIGALANLSSLIIDNGSSGIASMEDLTDLSNLVTLKLTNLGVTDIGDLFDLNADSLETIDLSGNPQDICIDVAALETDVDFEGVTISSDCL